MLIDSLLKWGEAHAPEILTAVTIAATGAAIGFTAYESPKAAKLLEEEERIKHRPLTIAEEAKTVWRNYIPTAAFYGIAIASSIGATRLGNRKAASLATACTMAESAFAAYRQKVVEVAGEAQDKEIRKKIAQEKATEEEHAQKRASAAVIVGSQDVRCFDVTSGRFFESDADSIRGAVNATNEQLLKEGYISLNELYENLGLETTDIYEGLGWNILVQGLIEPEFDSCLCEDSRPCLTLDFQTPPIHNYEDVV